MELKPLDLPFGNNFILSLRDELFDMEANSRIFEEDLDIVNEVQRHIKNGSDMALPSTLLAKDGYNIQHDTLGLRYYLTILCSLLSHDDNSSKDIAKEMDEAYSVIDEAPQSNIHAEVKSTCYSDDSDSEIFRVKRRSYKATTQKNNQFCPFKTRTSGKGLKLKEYEHVIVCNLEFEGGRGPDDYDDGLIDIIEKAQILPFPGNDSLASI
ncbi:hypothetical protein Tco_0991908 [Tanacetum coccineum]|uniref:Uncharacterized protein n=1 Tax=Tanacetum coccineum TaxID=301880 RepID=A0ABQ5F1P1_9ASTR